MTISQQPKRRIVLVEISKLRPHRLQEKVFRDTTGDDFEDLKRAVESGNIDPIEITVDNVIIDGHQRVRAAKEVGLKEIPAWIRSDLTGWRAVDKRFIVANLNRRQMSRLDQARAYQELMGVHARGDAIEGDTRDYIAKRFGVSGRSLDRWGRVLQTPKEVQGAIAERRLSMKDGTDVSFLPHEKQKEIADLIRAGQDPKKVVDQFANKSRQQRRKPVRNPHARKLREFLETAEEFLAQSAKHRNMARKTLTVDDVDSLRKLKAFCRKSLTYIEQNPEKCRNQEQRIAAAVSRFHEQRLASAGQ